MLQLPAGREASRGEPAPQYERHRSEQALLYQLIEEYHPAFEVQWATEGRVLPDYVRREFNAAGAWMRRSGPHAVPRWCLRGKCRVIHWISLG